MSYNTDLNMLNSNTKFLKNINDFISKNVPHDLDLDNEDKSYYVFENKKITINIDGIITEIRCDSDFVLALYNMVSFSFDRIYSEYTNEFNNEEED